MRKKAGWTQQHTAARLRVSQPYLSLMERGERPVPPAVATKLARLADVPPTALPLEEGRDFNPDAFAAALGTLGYPPYAYRRSSTPENPAVLVLTALRQEQLEPRLAEALPWLLVRYPNLNWEWLVDQAKRDNLQNRLGYLTTVAKEVAEQRHDPDAASTLLRWQQTLDEARLAKTDTLGRRLTNAERKYLLEHRPPAATHWNLLTRLSASDVQDGV